MEENDGNENAATAQPDVPLGPAPKGTVCGGAYVAHVGLGISDALGVAMPFGQTSQRPAQVTDIGCGAGLEVVLDGVALTLTRVDPNETRYSGQLPSMGDGATRTVTLSCDADFALRGQLVAQDPNLRIERAMWLLPVDASNPKTC